MNKANECTCPSGDGSLVHPCPAHPAVEQVGGDERAVDGKPRATKCPDCGEGDLMPGDLCACGYETDPSAGYACSECDGSGDGYVGEVCRECDGSGWFVTPEQARAALAQPSGEVVVTKNESGAIVSVTRQDKEGRVLSVIAESQPSPAPADEKPGDSILCSGCFAKGVGPEHFDEAGKCLARQQTEPLGAEFAQVLSDNLPELLSTGQAEQAEAERPEGPTEDELEAAGLGYPLHKEEAVKLWYSGFRSEVITVLEAWEAIGHDIGMNPDKGELLDSLRYMLEKCEAHDAALARVAELERQEPVATVAKVPGEDWNSLDFHRDLQDMQPGTKFYAAPVAQAQQLHDLDKQCRDDVARALGLRPNQERGFAWSYLVASIKSCVKASEDSAQAQHCVPELLVRAEDFVSGKEVPQAWLDVQAERRRQITAEGWTPEHDDLYCAAELPRAAAAYILNGANDEAPAIWPFSAKWWKPSTARRDMVKACALALAEIERLDRAASGKEVGHE
ncbi:hypothetical protein [Pseudomonas aeruginosa]|uniref:hypothetical protein n=1 Tax=Pseudomonas aeruginosa TaxID=287 RepID=UPI0029C0816E|nr:hypothetical protein [Pseudomonas aeruginosa]